MSRTATVDAVGSAFFFCRLPTADCPLYQGKDSRMFERRLKIFLGILSAMVVLLLGLLAWGVLSLLAASIREHTQ